MKNLEDALRKNSASFFIIKTPSLCLKEGVLSVSLFFTEIARITCVRSRIDLPGFAIALGNA